MIGELLARELLSVAHLGRMLEILGANFRNVTAERFQEDLAEKNWVILIRDDAGAIVGFSTLLFYETRFEGSRIAVVYSGDTIIEKGGLGLRRAAADVDSGGVAVASGAVSGTAAVLAAYHVRLPHVSVSQCFLAGVFSVLPGGDSAAHAAFAGTACGCPLR